MSRGLGWTPAEPDLRDYRFTPSVLGSAAIVGPSEIDLQSLEPPIYNQRSNNDCVAEALTAAIYIIERRELGEARQSSRLFTYWNARRLHNAQWIDKGTSIRLACKVLNKLGAPDETYCPWTTNELVVNRQPKWQAYMMAHPRSQLSYYRILDEGDARSEMICQALAAGYPVVFGAPITGDFCKDLGTDIIPRPRESAPLIGGHAMLLTGYRRHNGQLHFRCRNSWGTQWRDGGRAWLTEDFVHWPALRSLTVIKGWRAVS